MGLKSWAAKRFVRFLQSGVGAQEQSPPEKSGDEPSDLSGGFVSRSSSGVVTVQRFGQQGSFELHRGGKVVIQKQGQPPSTREIAAALATSGEGISGLQAFGGVISEDYNSDMATLESRMDIYEQMRRSDGALAVVENLVTMPILAADWRMEGGDSEKFRERLWENLHGEMSHAFSEMLREALLGVLYGFAMHQIVPERQPDGFEGFRKFQELGRKTVYEWKFDRAGGVQGFTQFGYRMDDSNWVEQFIPIEEMVLWTWREDLGNPEGMGALRQGVKHWRIKEILETWAGMRIERTAIPYPIWTPPSYNTNVDKRDEVLAISDRMIAGECVGVIEPAGWRLRLEWGGPSDVPFLDMIEWEHMNILQGIMGQFVGYGSGGQSAGAPLGREAADIFLLNMNWIADWLCDTFNRHVIPKAWLWNYGTKFLGRRSKEMPKLAHSKIGLRDMDAFVRLVRGLLDRNTLMVPSLLHQLISLSGLAPISDEDAKSICEMKNSNAALNSRGIQEQPGTSGGEQATVPDTASAENGSRNMLGR